MKIKLAMWSLKTTHYAQARIDPKPQFQRGEVWSVARKQLLIDSVLRGYDLPKIYLSETKNNPHHEFEVADGQQRLRAFWGFFDDGFALGAQSADIGGVDLSGKVYSTLPAKYRRALDKFKLVIAILIDAPNQELRTLFARLQMGVILTPPELRNAIASAVGSMINTLAETHEFFQTAGIPDTRFKRQDFLAHALALAHYENAEDLKAPLLKKFYEEFPTNYPQKMARMATEVLDSMYHINLASGGVIRTKWGFVDLFWFVWQRNESMRSIDIARFGAAYSEFERKRQLHNAEPEELLETSDAHLYDYIQAFNTSGAESDRIEKRRRVIERYFRKYVRMR